MRPRKRLIFCTYSSIYSSIVLQQLVDDDDIEVVAILNSTRVHHPQYGQIRGAIKQIQLSGWRYSSYLFFVTDLFSWLQPLLSLKGNSLKNNALKTVHTLAKQHQIPILNSRDINQPDAIQFITEKEPEVLLAAHFNQLIKCEILELNNLKSLNIHPSLLPAYKGVDPVFFAMLNNEKRVGVSLHEMAETFDTGKILSQQDLLISENDTLLSVNKKLFAEGASLARAWIKEEQGTALEDGNSEGQYDSWPTPEQVRQLKQSGRLLNRLSGLWR